MINESLGSAWVAIRANMASFAEDLAAGKTAATKSLADFGASASEVGRMFTVGLTAPIVAGFGLSAKAAIDFESSFAGVRKTVDGTDQELSALARSFRDMAMEIPVSVHELNNIGEAAGALGIKKENIIGFTRTMADLGVTTDLTSSQAADAFARIANVMQLPQEQFSNMGSAVVALGNAGASTESQIVAMATNIAGAGAQVGLSTAEVLGFSSALASVGIEAEAGGSAISKVFMDMATAVADGGAKLDEFARVAGKPVEEFARTFREDAAGATAQFITGLARLKAEGENVFATLDGLELRDIRVQRALLNASGAGELFNQQLALGKKAFQENSALADEAAKRYETVESQLILLKNTAYDAAITFGESMLPAIKGVIPVVKEAGDWAASAGRAFSALPEPVRNTVFAVAALTAAIGPMLFVAGKAIETFVSLRAAALLLGGPTGGIAMVTSAVTTMTTALVAAAPQLLVFGAAVAAVMKTGQLVRESLAAQKQEQDMLNDSVAYGAIHMRTLQIASEVAQRPIGSLTEAKKILIEHARKLREETDKAAASTTAAVKPQTDYVAQLAATKKAVADLSPETKRQMNAQFELGLSVEKVAENMKLSTEVVGMYKDGLDKTTKSAKDAAKALEEKAKAEREYYNWLGERQMEAAAAEMKAAEEKAKAEREYYNDVGVRRMENEAAEMAAIEAKEKANRDYYNWLGERQMEAAAADMAAAEAKKKAWGALGKDLSQSVMRAIQGGGDIGKTLGGEIGSKAGSWAGEKFAEFATKQIGGKLGSVVGGALGSVMPVLGTILGSLGGSFIGKLFGGGEGKKVNDMRDKFVEAAGGIHELNVQAQKAGMTLDRFLKAKTVKEYEAAVGELRVAFEGLEARREKATGLFEQIMELGSRGVPDAMKPTIDSFIQLGLLTDEQAEKLRGLGENAKMPLQEMQAAIDIFKGRTESLGPAFAQAKIDETAMKYANAIELMVENGGDIGAILFDAKEELGALAAEAMRTGRTLPANLKPWIEELVRSGNLVDENGKKIEDISSLKFGEAQKTEAEIAQEGWQEITRLIQELVDQIRGPLTGAIRGIPDRNIKVGVQYDDPGFEPRMPGGGDGDTSSTTPAADPTPMAEGGLVTRPMLALAGEAGPEAVIPLKNMSDFGMGREAVEMLAKQNSLLEAMLYALDGLDDVLATRFRDAVRGTL